MAELIVKPTEDAQLKSREETDILEYKNRFDQIIRPGDRILYTTRTVGYLTLARIISIKKISLVHEYYGGTRVIIQFKVALEGATRKDGSPATRVLEHTDIYKLGEKDE